MLETCANCRYYCSTLADTESDYHIHDWCKVWKTCIPSDVWQYCDEGCYWDDIECGLVKCHAFKPGEERLTLETAENRRSGNEEEHMFQTQP